jgi:hypothetical protein
VSTPLDRRQERARAIVAYCRILGVRLSVASGRLLYDAPGALDPELRALLVQHKPELLELLAAAPAGKARPRSQS